MSECGSSRTSKTYLHCRRANPAGYIYQNLFRGQCSREAGWGMSQTYSRNKSGGLTVLPASSKPSICSNAIFASSERLYLIRNTDQDSGHERSAGETHWMKAYPLLLPVTGSRCKSTNSSSPKGSNTCLMSDSVKLKCKEPT